MHRQVDAMEMGIHNVCLYKEVDKNYTGCNLKTTALLDCVLIGASAVIRSNTVRNVTRSRGYFLCTRVVDVTYARGVIFCARVGRIIYILNILILTFEQVYLPSL